MLLSAEGKLKTNPVCRHGEAGLARQAISLGRPEDWEQGVGRRKKDGPEWLTVLHGWDKTRQPPPCTAKDGKPEEGNHHHAGKKMGILKATICNLGQWRQSHLLSRPSQSIFNSFMKLATNYRKKGASLALCKIHYNQTTGCLAKVHSTSDPMKNIRIHLRKNENKPQCTIKYHKVQ